MPGRFKQSSLPTDTNKGYTLTESRANDRRSHTARPRVFVSSVVEGFGAFREAAREGILAAGGEPVLVNEDFPSLATSSRNACLDAVESSDIYVAIIGSRGGWTTPSGRLVVEEEYEHAVARRLPVLAFIQSAEQDQEAERLARRLSDYVNGRFRAEFQSPDHLRRAVEQALRDPIERHRRPLVSPDRVRDRLMRPHRMHGEAALHFVLVPERDEELVSPMEMDGPDFRHDLYEVGLERSVGLLSHEAAKEYDSLRDSAVIHQSAERGRRGEAPEVRIEIETNGRVSIDAAITGRRTRGTVLGFEGMMLVRADVEDSLRAAFAFSALFFERFDPYRRQERFLYGVALTGLQHKKWVEEVRPSNSMSLSLRERADPLVLLPEPRVVTRVTLQQANEEITRVVRYAQHELR